MNIRLAALAFASLFLIQCTKSGGDSSDSGGNACDVLGLKVINGEQCSVAASSVVAIVAFDSSGTPLGTCSGAMLTQNKVLTAAHCIDITGAVNWVVAAEAASTVVTRAAKHPSYVNTTQVSPFDVGVMTLRDALPLPTVPILISRTAQIGDRATVFGYGNDEEGNSFAELGYDALKATFVNIADRGDGAIYTLYDETNTGACEGDSGGPLVSSEGEITGIIGVVQAGSGPVDCQGDTIDVFTDVQSGAVFNFVMSEAPSASVL